MFATGTRQTPRQAVPPSKLCATLACRGDCAWTEDTLSNHPIDHCREPLRRARSRAHSAGTASQPGAIMIPIEKMTVGAAPADFEFARTGQGATGQWIVVEDATAASKRAIEQSNTDRTDFRFPLAIYQPVTARTSRSQSASSRSADVSIRPAALRCESRHRMTTTSCARTRWKTTSASTGS